MNEDWEQETDEKPLTLVLSWILKPIARREIVMATAKQGEIVYENPSQDLIFQLARERVALALSMNKIAKIKKQSKQHARKKIEYLFGEVDLPVFPVPKVLFRSSAFLVIIGCGHMPFSSSSQLAAGWACYIRLVDFRFWEWCGNWVKSSAVLLNMFGHKRHTDTKQAIEKFLDTKKDPFRRLRHLLSAIGEAEGAIAVVLDPCM